MDNEDFYDILDVKRDASQDDIKKAWRSFSRKYHPDMQHGKSDEEKKAAEETFKKGQAAYECLSDPEKRDVYDRYGLDGLNGHAQQGGFGSGLGEGLREFLKRRMSGFGFGFNPFSGMDGFNPFGEERQSKRKAPSNNEPEDGQSYRIRMEVDLEDVIFGAEKEFTMDGFDVCPDCHGHKCDGYDECPECDGRGMTQRIQGNMIFQSTCHHCGGSGYSPKNVCKTCNGSGRVKAKKQIKLKIPKGMPEGGQLRARGKGIPGINGGEDGDLYVVVTTKKHPLFRRNPDYGNLRLEMDLYVNPLITACGGTIQIPTPYEMKSQYVAAGISDGQKIIIDDGGIRTDDEYKRTGPLVVTIKFDTINAGRFTTKEKNAIKEAYDVISKDKDCLVYSRQQMNELNKTKLPWVNSKV